jgi:hypothetical protein
MIVSGMIGSVKEMGPTSDLDLRRTAGGSGVRPDDRTHPGNLRAAVHRE